MKKKTVIPYKHYLVDRAKDLRKNSPYSEKLLWKYLKGKQLNGYDFDRQKPIDNYIVDFFCNELRLVIEIDGITHENRETEDIQKQSKLVELGLFVLRFNALDVVNNTEGVLEEIRFWIIENTLPTPSPSQQGS